MNTGQVPCGSGTSTRCRCGKRAAAASTLARTRGSASSSQRTPTRMSSSSTSVGAKPGASTSSAREQLVDVPGHRPGVVEARREREAPVERHEPVGRLEARDAAAGGRYPDRAARVGAEAELGQPGGQRRGGAAARAARDPSWRERVRDRAEVRVLGGRPVRELVQVGLPHVDVAGGLEPAHGLRRLGRDVLGEQDRAVRRDEPRRVEQVLDREPHPRFHGLRALRACEEDPVGGSAGARRSHSLVTLASHTCRTFLNTLASGRRLGEP